MPRAQPKKTTTTTNKHLNFPIKKNEIMPFAATWMDLEIVILSEARTIKTNKCHVISITCGI